MRCECVVRIAPSVIALLVPPLEFRWLCLHFVHAARRSALWPFPIRRSPSLPHPHTDVTREWGVQPDAEPRAWADRSMQGALACEAGSRAVVRAPCCRRPELHKHL
eukprot:1314586-Pleurochrysis_carterae.AAC.2